LHVHPHLAARTKYLTPAVSDFASRKKAAKIVMYLTWGYHDGNEGACPSSDNAKCVLGQVQGRAITGLILASSG
jgi:hypothetical protein